MRSAELELCEPEAGTQPVGENCLDAGHLRQAAVSPANEKRQALYTFASRLARMSGGMWLCGRCIAMGE